MAIALFSESKSEPTAARDSSSDMQQITGGGRLCVPCKGRLWCGLQSCPIIDRIRVIAPKAARIKQDVFGPSPPNLFVGRSGYPDVFAGPLVAYDDEFERGNSLLCDDPSQWFGCSLGKIIEFRSSFARGMQKVSVKNKGRTMDELSNAVMAANPVDMEVSFQKPPSFHLSFSGVSQPMGPSERFKSLRIASNPSIPKKIDSIVGENLAVRQSLPELLEHGFGSYYLQKLLSAGILGKKGGKKMVPTRWSITASDRMVADHYLREVRHYDSIPEISLYSSEYLDNRFEILVLPGAWEFEQFESWAPKSTWNQYGAGTAISHEYEPYGGRSDYAESEGGGYYAGRLGAAEALFNMRRQGRVVIFREIGEGYAVPVGVWEVRENCRNAFRSGPVARFPSLKEALSFVKPRLRLKSLSAYLSKSRILSQSRLAQYF